MTALLSDYLFDYKMNFMRKLFKKTNDADYYNNHRKYISENDYRYSFYGYSLINMTYDNETIKGFLYDTNFGYKFTKKIQDYYGTDKCHKIMVFLNRIIYYVEKENYPQAIQLSDKEYHVLFRIKASSFDPQKSLILDINLASL
jgi:hypothetical protein